MSKKGHYIREWRQYARLTQAEFARAIGMSQSNLNHIETGRTPYTQITLEKMADHLKVRPATLLSVDPIAEEEKQRDGEPTFMPQVEEILTAMQPATRSLALDLLKSALRHEKLVEDLDKPKSLNLRKGMLNEKFRI
jgi:transcriptional regulator with XRE-family HTH domain